MKLQDLKLFPELKTERLLLRQLSITDAPAIYKLRSDEGHNTYIDRPRATSIYDAEAFIERCQQLINERKSLFWVIAYKEVPSDLLGTILLWNFDHQNNKAEIGYELLGPNQGKGIMREAIDSIIEFAFNNLKLSVIEAWTHPDNKRSINTLERSGFVKLRLQEKDSADENDMLIYSLDAAGYSYT